jgi:S-(hydroxymethyl)glutathione dehydrogenase/alcohol dehydrogenase
VRDVTARALLLSPVRAAVCHQFGSPLSVEDIDLGKPQAGEVEVRVHACGICHSDITFMDGLWGGDLPAVYGHEVAGVVTAVGDGVAGLAVGGHVVVTLVRTCGTCFFCRRGQPTQCEGTFAIDQRAVLSSGGRRVVQGVRVGGFAESVTVHASQAIAIPISVPLDSACLLGCAVATGVGAVRNTARVESGASVAVVGAGGVGVNSIQAACMAGAAPVIAVDVSDSRLAAACELGATDAVNSAKPDPEATVRSLTGGRGADYTIITSGNPAAIELGLRLARRAGTVIIVGMTAANETIPINPGDVADAALRILGSKLGDIRPQEDIPAMIELYQQGRLKLDELVTARYPLDQVNEGIAVARRAGGLRTVLQM